MFPPKEIIVTVGGKQSTFDTRLWRRAISAYLDAVWAQDPDNFDSTLVICGIELKRSINEYNTMAWANSVDLSEMSPVFAGTIDTFCVGLAANDIEIGLARLVRSKKPLALVIKLPGIAETHIWTGFTKPGYGPILATDINYRMLPRAKE